METQRQESFKRLRPPCVELSSVSLRFRGNQASAFEVTRALEPVHLILRELAEKNALDGKLAEYAFFPLTNIFNETQRLPARCLEIAVQSLRILVAEGWRQQLSPALGKQLIILMTLVVGGSPNKVEAKQPLKAQAPEELVTAGFDCLHAIFDALDGPVAERTIFHEVGTATVVDQTVYILLEGLVDERSDDACCAAGKALHALFARITDRVVLASIMPRTVSALAKVLRPSTQTRRSYKLLESSLRILTHTLRTILNDRAAVAERKRPPLAQMENDTLALDDSWLKATTTQIKLALANVIQIRRHQRPEVQFAMLGLCVMVIEDCQTTLAESIPMMVETVVVLADKESESPNDAYKTLIHVATSYPVVLDSLKESLNTWLVSFPRVMQSNDETAKQRGIRQISTAFQVLSQVQLESDILTGSLASGLCDSVGAVVKHGSNALQPLATSGLGDLSLEVLGPGKESMQFPPVLLEHRSQQQTLKDLQSMISRLNLSESGNEVTRLIVNRLHAKADDSVVGPLWLALTSLRAQSRATAAFDDFLADGSMEQSNALSNRGAMIEELYYLSLMILTDLPADGSGDWRTSALALEAVGLQAQQLGEAFRPELMDALYPTLQLLASNNSDLQKHAIICLNILTKSCNYPDTSSMIIENVDYLVNSVALKLNTFDVSPYPPQVLFMMVKLCGARLIPYLDDVVDSIFGIVDLYHGYPKLVEMLFKTLAAIVQEGSRQTSLLTIDSGRQKGPHDSRKLQYQHLSISAIAADISHRKTRRAKIAEDDMGIEGDILHPKKPWSETYEKPAAEPESIEELLNQAESDEPLPPPKEPDDSEKPLSKTHNLLLHIVKSIPSHLSSPSPYLRRSLLSIFIDVLPTLSRNENSFLPLINDIWPSVASRVVFPSSLGNQSSSSSSLVAPSTGGNNRTSNPLDTQTFQDETFVITTACQAIEAMCKGAGDFMASRVETEFSRWERLYQRVWTKVRLEAEAANERRVRQQFQSKQRGASTATLIQSLGPVSSESQFDIAITSSLALSPIISGSRAFTPHHAVWRSLMSLFLTILTHVRLPLQDGDRICEMLGAWIVLFVGPSYYFHPARRSDHPPALDDAQRSMLESVEDAIQAMEIWNPDLTWYIFVHQSNQMAFPAKNGWMPDVSGGLEFNGEKMQFAGIAF